MEAVAAAVLRGVALIADFVRFTPKVQIKFFGTSGHIPLVAALLAAAIFEALIVFNGRNIRLAPLLPCYPARSRASRLRSDFRCPRPRECWPPLAPGSIVKCSHDHGSP
jgi:uncharacterized integral membrane protein